MPLSLPPILRCSRRGYFPGAKAVIRGQQNTASRRYDSGVIKEQLTDLAIEEEDQRIYQWEMEEKQNAICDAYEKSYWSDVKWDEEDESDDYGMTWDEDDNEEWVNWV